MLSDPQNQTGNNVGVIKALAQMADPSSGAHGTHVGPDDGILREPQRRSKRGSVLSLEAEETLRKNDAGAHAKLTETYYGQLLQLVLIVATIFAYVGNPILVTWAKTVGYDDQGDPIRPTAYMEVFLIWWMKVVMTVIGLLYAFRLDFGTGSWSNVAKIFNFADLKRWSWVALGWSVADVAEQMAGGRLDPALYTVLSQSRLVGTALMMRVLLGTKRVTLQWSILVNLSFVIIGYRLIGTGQRENTLLGFAATATKMVLSVVCGVVAQGLLQNHDADKPFVVILSQVTFMSTLWMTALVPVYILYVAPSIGEAWSDAEGNFYGFWGGVPYCPNGGDACPDAEKIRITAWTWKVWVVLAFNVYRDYTVNYILKVFDALVKNLCNAFATVVAYFLTVTFLGQDFDILKGIFSIVIAFEIAHYAMAQDMPMPADPQEEGKSTV